MVAITESVVAAALAFQDGNPRDDIAVVTLQGEPRRSAARYAPRVTERPFSYELATARDRLVLHGDLDEGATVQLRSLVSELTDGLTRDLTVDLSDVDLLPSSAVGVHRQRPGHRRRQDAAAHASSPRTARSRLGC